MSGKQGTAVTDLMQYNVKPTAVRSENLLNNIKASNGNLFAGSSEGQIIFDVPANVRWLLFGCGRFAV